MQWKCTENAKNYKEVKILLLSIKSLYAFDIKNVYLIYFSNDTKEKYLIKYNFKHINRNISNTKLCKNFDIFRIVINISQFCLYIKPLKYVFQSYQKTAKLCKSKFVKSSLNSSTKLMKKKHLIYKTPKKKNWNKNLFIAYV